MRNKVAPDPRHRRLPQPVRDGRGGRGVGRRAATVAMRRVDPNARGSIVEVLSEAGLEVLPNTAGCFTARDAIATAKLAREALETDWVKLEVIGDDHTAAGSGGAAARRRGAGGGWLHGAALHERRPDLGPPARGRRLRRRDAARLADRQRHGHQQPLQPAADHRGPRGAGGDPRRGHRHGIRRRARDGGRLRRRAARSAISRAADPVRMARAMRKAVEAGYEAGAAGRIRGAPTPGLLTRGGGSGSRRSPILPSTAADGGTNRAPRVRRPGRAGAPPGRAAASSLLHPDVSYEDPVAVEPLRMRRRARASRARVASRPSRTCGSRRRRRRYRAERTCASPGAPSAPSAATSGRCCRRATAT